MTGPRRFVIAAALVIAIALSFLPITSARARSRVYQLSVVPGTRSIIYRKAHTLFDDRGQEVLNPTQELVGVSWEGGKAHDKKILRIIESGSRCFPTFFATDAPGQVFLTTFQDPGFWSKISRFLGMFDATSLLLRIAADPWSCTEVVSATYPEGMLSGMIFNCRNGQIPISFCCHDLEDPAGGKCRDQVLNLSTGKRVTVAEPARDSEVAIITSSDEMVYWPNMKAPTNEPIPLHLGDSVIEQACSEVFGVTPDGRHVFYSPHLESEEVTSATLWAFDSESKAKRQLSDWVGRKFRVCMDSRRFGFIETIPAVKKNGRTRVAGARVLDLSGEQVDRKLLPSPIDARAYDWSPDYMELAYFDEVRNKVVIRKFDGTLIAELDP